MDDARGGERDRARGRLQLLGDDCGRDQPFQIVDVRSEVGDLPAADDRPVVPGICFWAGLFLQYVLADTIAMTSHVECVAILQPAQKGL